MKTLNLVVLFAGLAIPVSLGGCSPETANTDTGAAAQPFRADFSAEGYATILDAPPADFVPLSPADPEPRTAGQDAADAEFLRVAKYQNSVMDEVQALAERLRRDERENFVSLHYDNEGELGVVFEFLRNGSQTLRRYSENPTFRGVTVRWSMDELHAAADYMWETFGQDRVIQATGIRSQEVTAEISVSETEFNALVRRKGVAIPEQVTLVFNSVPPVPLANPPKAAVRDETLPITIARHIRIFPRHDRPAGALNSINSQVKVVLKDGCFRAASHDNALVLFPFGADLFVDSQNYLAFGNEERPGYARVGEEVVFMGSVHEIDTPELVDPIHRACGPGKVIKVEGLSSAAARERQESLDYAATALRSLENNYGLGRAEARRAFEWLERRQAAVKAVDADGKPVPPVTASLIIMSPPPPVMDSSDCPAGSQLVSGLCRTPEGYLRPLPAWLEEFMEQDR